MADDDTYPEELYIDSVDIYEYTQEMWDELLEVVDLQARLEGIESPDSNEYDEWFTEDTTEPEEEEPDEWEEWFKS